jgi:RNA polymerase sigma-70 factor (ECF subfamily)
MKSKTTTSAITNENRQELFSNCIAKKNKKLSDNELAILVREYPQLFNQIADRYRRKLCAYFLRIERNWEEVEDLVQDVFLKACENLHSYNPSQEFSYWIFSIAHNTAVNYVKQVSLKKSVSLESITEFEDKLGIPSLEENPDQLCMRKEINKEVDDVIKKLPAEYKKVLILRYYYSKSYREISKILGKSMGAIGTLIRRAKNKMMVQMNETSGQMTTLETRHL